MPRVIAVEGLPLIVRQASDVLGSGLRMELIRYYRDHPDDSQAAAARALKVPRTSLTANIHLLVEHGVLLEEPAADNRSANTYRVDEKQLEHLVNAIVEHVLPALGD